MRAYLIIAGCLCLAGCMFGRDDDPDFDRDHDHETTDDRTGGQTSKPVSRGSFCQQWAEAACSSAVVSACQASNTEECRQRQDEFCRMQVSSDTSDVARNECISAVTAAYRDADLRGDELALVLRMGGACSHVLRGTVRSGEACTSDNECDRSKGYACIKKADTGAGTCQIPQSISPGRDCRDADAACSAGFYCDGRNCIETLPAGEPCSIHEQCGEDGFCSEEGKCQARVAVNDPCSSDLECERGICADFQGEQVCTDRVLLSRADPLCENLR